MIGKRFSDFGQAEPTPERTLNILVGQRIASKAWRAKTRQEAEIFLRFALSEAQDVLVCQNQFYSRGLASRVANRKKRDGRSTI